MSGIPLVNSAIRAYEQTKASSRVVKVCVIFFLALYWDELMRGFFFEVWS